MNSRSLRKLIGAIEEFEHVWKGRDRQWAFFLKEKRRWLRFHVTQYEGTYYFSGSDFDSFSCPGEKDLGPDLDGRLSVWTREIALWKRAVAHDPIEAQALLFKKIPLRSRRGVMQRRNVRLLLPQWMPIASELSRAETKEILGILRKAPPEPLQSMTLNKYLEYCRAAYQANPSTFRESGFQSGLSGKEYYKRYADGRHEGLLELAPESSKAFERWHKRGSQGGHPWEIYRGGNSTHIDMYVARPAYRPEGWEVHLRARSSTRLVETCRIALALTKAGLPVLVDDAESYIDRILDQDWVGIVPQEGGIAYAWQSFPQEWGVQDCVHLDWFFEENPRAKARLNRRLRLAAHWLPEEISAFLKS